MLNGIDVDALKNITDQVTKNPRQGMTSWGATTTWQGGTRSDTQINAFSVGGEKVERNFNLKVDEPSEFLGTNQFANPQDYLLTALNACIIVGYATLCAAEGIKIDILRIETTGDIDLRGFLGIDSAVKNGYDTIKFTVFITGDATAEQFQKIHEKVKASSPNLFNLANPINFETSLIVKMADCPLPY